ncbi:hypothetical protein ACFVH6_17535 [Spirillospora sp. NPDC127200]
MRDRAVAFGLGLLIPLAGAVAAAVVLALVVSADPAMVRSAGFTWGSTFTAMVSHALFGFLGARTAARRLARAGAHGGAAVVLSCAGPLLVAVLTQTGLAAQGRPGVSLLVLLAATAGAATGFLTAAYRRRPAGSARS